MPHQLPPSLAARHLFDRAAISLQAAPAPVSLGWCGLVLIDAFAGVPSIWSDATGWDSGALVQVGLMTVGLSAGLVAMTGFYFSPCSPAALVALGMAGGRSRAVAKLRAHFMSLKKPVCRIDLPHFRDLERSVNRTGDRDEL